MDITDRLMESDRILICSDGLSDMLEDDAIERLLASGSTEESCAALIDAAKRNGGVDNDHGHRGGCLISKHEH